MGSRDVLRDRLAGMTAEQVHALRLRIKRKKRVERRVGDPMKFGLFFFSDNGSHRRHGKYEFLIESAKFADENNFHSVWVPERHFHEFGGPYPSPAVLLSSLSTITENLQLRSGSVVMPLHHPARIAEEWSVIDNLSNGRVGLSAASGWNKDDFIYARTPYKDRKKTMFESIEEIQRLWRNETVSYKTLEGHEVNVSIYPEPVQDSLPIWITTAANPETWKMAAAIGANILTGLMEQSLEELGEKITLYHQELIAHGFDPETKEVSVMMHTYLGDDLNEVKETVKPAMLDYLKTHMSAYEKQLNHARNTNIDLNLVTEKDKQTLIELGFERYFSHSALLGTPDSCLKLVQALSHVGVTEICSLVNFGLDYDTVFSGLLHLNQLRMKVASEQAVEV